MSAPASHIHPEAHRAYERGDFKEAIRGQTDFLNALVTSGAATIEARKLLSLYFFSSGDIASAIRVVKTVVNDCPDDPESLGNLGVMLKKQGRIREAIGYLLRSHEMAPEQTNSCDALAHCFSRLKNHGETQKYGRRSLELKDGAAEGQLVWPISDRQVSPAPFSPENRQSNVISFSLWGDKERYLRGALRNAVAAPHVYPSWTCRFYCDDRVPPGFRQKLKNQGAQVKMKPRPSQFYEGLLWRFEVLDDATVDRFLIRDADSIVNVKERVAVDEWLQSDCWFHAMRDFPSHTEVLLAGMWGGANGILPSLAELLKAFHPTIAPTSTYDQLLLRECVWPTVRQSVMIHDSVYTGCLGSKGFPPFGDLPPGRHIGQNEAAMTPLSGQAGSAKVEPGLKRKLHHVITQTGRTVTVSQPERATK